MATTNADVVEALLWSALPTLIVSRRIYNLVRANALPEHRARYTPLRWASKFRWAAPHILSLTLAQLGGKDANDHDRRVVNLFLTREAIDPHVNRRRLLPRWTA